jgi:hypothetical protein
VHALVSVKGLGDPAFGCVYVSLSGGLMVTFLSACLHSVFEKHFRIGHGTEESDMKEGEVRLHKSSSAICFRLSLIILGLYHNRQVDETFYDCYLCYIFVS